MPEVTSHAPGAPSWAELSTTDEATALSFYSTLFGWQDDPQEMGPDSYYHMQKVNGLPACSIYQQGEEERSQNIAPHWSIYFTVNNVEETDAAVGRNGGQVVFGPMDVFEAGRMAMCLDPQGALFAIWQPNLHIGARIKGETGTMCWNELMTTDRAAAIKFYVDVLGMERGESAEAMDYPMLDAAELRFAELWKSPGIWAPFPQTGAYISGWTTQTPPLRRPFPWAPRSSCRLRT